MTKEKLNTKFIDDFSKEVYEQTYRYGNENINITQERIASFLSKDEKDKDYWTEKFLWALNDFKFVPGGRIISNAGTELKGTSMINCFVDGFIGKDQDSMEGILDALRRQALILKSEGGYGFCADVIRPRGSFISGIGNETPGAVRMLDMWDTQSSVITEGSGSKTKKEKAKIKIRKGAQMVTMSCWHPDVEEFVTSKQTSGRLTKFNMSVLVTDSFIDAVKNKQPWNLEFPNYEKHSTEYKNEWNGNIEEWKSKGYETIVYKTYEDANILYDIIMTSAYNRNEPGVLFLDTMNRLNNLKYCEYISATNPCGEQILPIGGVCLLGSLNLTQFIKEGNWDYDKLYETIGIAIRMMDNVNDLTYVPLEVQRDNLKNKRRIGLGIMGYGSSLIMMKVKYGSEKALKLTEDIMKFIANSAYKCSALLAGEKGSFPLYDQEKYLNSEFIKNVIDKEVVDLIRKNGIRNSHLLSIQPTGNTACLANNVSGGLEPLFLVEYIRTSIMPYAPDGLSVPKNIDWSNKTYESESLWEFIKEGDDTLLSTHFNGYRWKFDKQRGLLRESVVKDYSVRYLESIGEWEQNADYIATTSNLGISEHVDTMRIMSKYIDSAMSKTINLPNDYSYDDFKSLYMETHDTGTIKGCTIYRAGTMASVLSSLDSSSSNGFDKLPKTDAPKRPKTLECDVHHLTVGGDKWIVIVGLFSEDPYEVFAFKKKNINLSEKIKSGRLTKIKSGRYDLEFEHFTLEDIKGHFESDEQEALTRMISTSLRHGADINFIYQQLQKSEGTIVSFSKAIGRTLKKYLKDEMFEAQDCPDCGSKGGLIMQEGCFVCKDCVYSKCGS